MSTAPVTKLYISGPMTGLPDFNKPAFWEAGRKLGLAGYQVWNPADLGLGAETRYELALREAIKQMMNAEGVALLPRWQGSRGARIEADLAQQLAMPIRSVNEWITLAAERRGQWGNP